jgi:modulator of FtsH protease HflC
MKRNYLTLAVGVLLVVLFAFLLFTFQVRLTEVALVTTFGKPTRNITAPGLYGRLPWPIQKVQKFDKRIQNSEGKFEETLTRDGYNILIMTYVGWTIADPTLFRERFGGSVARAQSDLESLIRSAKNAVVGQHPFSHFISTDEKQLKFVDIENEMLQAVQQAGRQQYGVDIRFLGIKRLGLPESITQKVFTRMKEERQRFVQKLQADGERESINIRSAADRDRAKILADAERRATEIRGQAEAEAAKSYAVFEQNPDLAVLLLKLNALELSLKDRATLVLDQRMPPFDVLSGKMPGNAAGTGGVK